MEEKLKVFCNRCNTTTNHSIRCQFETEDSAEIEENGVKIDFHIADYFYQIIQCDGCEVISYRTYEHFPSYLDLDDQNGTYTVGKKQFDTLYPERRKGLLAEKTIVGLPILIKKTYREIIESYNLGLLILCSGGLRAIVEGICAYYKVNSKFLNARIDGLSQLGLIGKELGESLKVHKFLGDYALHRLEIPQKEEIESAIHLIELTLESLFDVPDRHKRLKESITNRISKK